MTVYNEEKRGQLSVFTHMIFDDNGKLISSRKIHVPLHQVDKNGFHYFVLYDEFTVLIRPVYDYLNRVLHDNPITTRRAAAFALRLLYCFLSLSGYEINDLNMKAMRELTAFLCGFGPSLGKYGLKTERSHETVNGYLSTYRSFFEHEDIKCEAINKINVTNTLNAILRDPDGFQIAGINKPAYKVSMPMSPHKNDTVPKYISPDEFRRIYKVIADAGDTQSQIIVHLLYGYGMRIGEVLGLTLEDVTTIQKDGKTLHALVLRNRVSDAKYQYCKNLPHVTDKRQYKRKDYRNAAESIIITDQFYRDFSDFINHLHEVEAVKHPVNYAKGEADIVSEADFQIDGPNHYLFLNKCGRILSDQVWSGKLRKYFIEAGVSVDYGTRQTNLSHRFRHGFAMALSYYSDHPVDSLELQKMMRHKSPLSPSIYLNPTEGDQLETTMNFQKELYEMIPELKEGLHIEM